MSADELVLTPLEESLRWAIQAFQPGIILNTLEEERAINSLARAALKLASIRCGQRDIMRWSVASTWRYAIVNVDAPEQVGNGPIPPEKAIRDWLLEQVNNKPTEGILVLSDVDHVLERSPGVVRVIREAVALIRKNRWRKTIVLLGKSFRLPEELRTSFMHFTFDLPDVEHFVALAQEKILELKKDDRLKSLNPSAAVVRAFAAACCGLTEIEACTLIALSIAQFRDIDDRTIALAQREKARILLQGGSLAMLEPRAGFAGIGGLEHAKTWADAVTPLIADPTEARRFGLKIPSGLLLIGCAGVGKSLMAEALAKEWRLPLLRFDVGACFAGLVGESEKNMRRMIEMANSLKPCVVFIDEIEKALGGDSLDGGTTSRVKGTLLTWLQEKADSIFVVATANDLTRLNNMPELIRAGRFDQTFFVDLPDSKAREAIFKIHFGKAGHTIEPETVHAAAQATSKYSGAEIETIVQQALRFAYNARPRKVTKALVLKAVSEVKPLAETMAEAVEHLRSWCREGRAKLAGGTLEQESRGNGQVVTQDAGNPLVDLSN